MTNKILTITMLVALSLTSCQVATKQGAAETKSNVSEEKNAGTSQTDTENKSTWWKGMRFENNRTVGSNPEEGGADFLIINQDQTASYKVGDIAEEMTWNANGDKLVLKNKMTEKEVIFTIGDLFLTDGYGTKWTIKK